MKKIFWIGMLVTLLTSCATTPSLSTGTNDTSLPTTSFVTSEKEEKISWLREPVISSYLAEKLAFSDYGSVTLIKNQNTQNIELSKENYVDLTDVDYYSTKEQTITAVVEDLRIQYSFTLTKKEIQLSSIYVASKMGVGYNLGDTFESDIGNYFNNADPAYALKIYEELGYKDQEDGTHDELFAEVRQHYTPYRGKTTAKTIDAIYQKGFRSIRLPVAWSNHMKDGIISERWLNRVQEVVDDCFKYKDLYVILTLMEPPSFSGYWLDDEYKDQTRALVQNVWTQVAERFQNYDHRLVFENLNEPLSKKYQWNMSSIIQSNPSAYKEANENLMYYNQLFVDTIRKAPGRENKNRFLTVNTYGNMAYLAYEKEVNEVSKFSFPTDTAKDRLIFNVHAYTPYNFCYGKTNQWSIDSAEDKASIDGMMKQLKTNYIDHGIGVVITEWGAVHANDDNAAREQIREDYYYYFMKTVTENGISAMIWDNTAIGDSWKEGFGFLNRHKAAGIYDDLVNISGTAYDNKTLWFYENVLDQMFKAYKEIKKR